ncbi:MAG: MarR family transcriptional regulator [Rhodothermales bacterium]
MKSLSSIGLELQAKRELPNLLREWTGLNFRTLGSAPEDFDFIVTTGDVALGVILKSDASYAGIPDFCTEDAHGSPLQDGAAHIEPVLVVPYMSDSKAEKMIDMGVNWIDLSGNASVRHESEPRMFISVRGRPNKFKRRGRPKNLFAPKSSRLTRYLLLHPGKAFRQRDLAEATNVDEGHVSRLVRRLEEEDLLARTPDGEVYPRDYDLLLDAWADGNAYRHEQLKGHVSGRSGEDVLRRFVDAVEHANVPYAATGLCAAWAYTKSAGFRSSTVFMSRQVGEGVLEEMGFRRESNAPNVTILFADDVGVFEGQRNVEGITCAAPVQVYVDLMHEGERADEFERALREDCIRWGPVDHLRND